MAQQERPRLQTGGENGLTLYLLYFMANDFSFLNDMPDFTGHAEPVEQKPAASRNNWSFLNNMPDFGSSSEDEGSEQEPVSSPVPSITPAPWKPDKNRLEELHAFMLRHHADDKEIADTLARNKDLAVKARLFESSPQEAVKQEMGQYLMRELFGPDDSNEPGVYFLSTNKPIPKVKTRREAFAAVYDDYAGEVEKHYKDTRTRRQAYQKNRKEVDSAVANVTAGIWNPSDLGKHLTPEQQEIYAREFDPVAIEKAGAAMGVLKDLFKDNPEEGLRSMVSQRAAMKMTHFLSDADADGKLAINEAAFEIFKGSVFQLMQETKNVSGDEYKFMHNLRLALLNPVAKSGASIGTAVQLAAYSQAMVPFAKEHNEKVMGLTRDVLKDYEDYVRNDIENSRVLGLLSTGQDMGNASNDDAAFMARAVNCLGSTIGQTAPFMIPYVGTAIAFTEAYDDNRNRAYFDGLQPGTAEWSAFIDAATSTAVEKISYGAIGKMSGTAWLIDKLPVTNRLRSALMGSFWKRVVSETGLGVTEETIYEPTAEAVLQWAARNVVAPATGTDVGRRYDFDAYFQEVSSMLKPDQLLATAVFVGGMTGLQSGTIRAAAESYSKQVEQLMLQGIDRDEARRISAIDDADARIDAVWKARSEAWGDPDVARKNVREAASWFRSVDEARATWESSAYQYFKSKYHFPDIEPSLDKPGSYKITTYNRETGEKMNTQEVGEEQLLAMFGTYVRQNEKQEIHAAQSAMAANALLRSAEESGEIAVQDMQDWRKPDNRNKEAESMGDLINEVGSMGEAEFSYLTRLATDEYQRRVDSGMSEQEALATPFGAVSQYAPLGTLMNLEKAFQERLNTARQTTGEESADSTQLFQFKPAPGTTPADIVFMASRGLVGSREVLEDLLEHRLSLWTGGDAGKLKAVGKLLQDAQLELNRMGFNVSFVGDGELTQSKVVEAMSKLALSNVLGLSDAIPLNPWAKDLLQYHVGALQDAYGLMNLARAYNTGKKKGTINKDLVDILNDLGVQATSHFANARIEAADIQAYEHAVATVNLHDNDETPTATQIRNKMEEDARSEANHVSTSDAGKSMDPEVVPDAGNNDYSPAANLPESMQGVFVDGASYNIGASAWIGMVPVEKLNLSPEVPQVKVNSNKKGIVNQLVGDYRSDAPPIYVWKRKNGTLEVVSGRHRLDLAQRTGTKAIAAYVYEEDAEHDAKWAKLLDYEQNMQDDQADELTAAIYTRETGLTDDELTRRGLTRGGTKSARGILIGREAREDLWNRFSSGSIKAQDAEAICLLTRNIADKSRIDTIQAQAAADMAKGKSLDFVASKIQLMTHASKDGSMVQGLISFGDSFEESMERAAEYIARSISIINDHINAIKGVRTISRKGAVMEAEGISAGLSADPSQRLQELQLLKAMYEKCGLYEKIRIRALTWDGESKPDPIGNHRIDMEAERELAAADAEAARVAEERIANESMTPGLGFSVMARDKEGNVLSPETFVTKPDGNPNWFSIPERKGQKEMPVRLLAGEDKGLHKGYGLTHIAASRDLDGLWKHTSPEKYLSSILANVSELWELAPGRELLVKGKKPSAWMVLQLARKDGYYSIVTAHPVAGSRKPNGKKLPLAERFAGKNQSVDRSQRPANPDTAPGTFPGGQGSKAATLASTAGGGDVFNIPQGTKSVNINDVTLHFVDGGTMPASFSLASMQQTVQMLLRPSMDVTRAEKLVSDFDQAIANWNRIATGKNGIHRGRIGAELFGAVNALISSARYVLPMKYQADLRIQMQWASVYASMAENGKIPEKGTLQGGDVFYEKFKQSMISQTTMAVTEEEASEILAAIGEKRLDQVMNKVMGKIRDRLILFAKDDMLARTMKRVQFAFPKTTPGKKSPRGKMDADSYRKLQGYLEMLDASDETVRDKITGLTETLSQQDDEEKAQSIESELLAWKVYGNYKGMSIQQAQAATESLDQWLITKRNAWDVKLDQEKRRTKYTASRLSDLLPGENSATSRAKAKLDQRTKFGKMLSSLPYGTMSYSQMMLAMSKLFGKQFSWAKIQEITDANTAILNANNDRNAWLYKTVSGIIGKKSEHACEKWLAEFDDPKKTGIILKPKMNVRLSMTVEEAEKWVSMTPAQRAEKRAELRRQEDVEEMKNENIPSEETIPAISDALDKYKENATGSGVLNIVASVVRKDGVRELECSRDGALYALLLHEQDDYATTFDENGEVDKKGLFWREGLEEADIQALYDFVGQDGIAYGYALRDKLREQGIVLARVYEERMGIPFALKDNYFRATFDRNSTKEKDTLTDKQVGGIGSGKYAMLIPRVNHTENAEWTKSASVVFLAAAAEQDNYIYTSHITTQWRSLLMNKDFEQKLRSRLGDDVMMKLNAWMNVIDGAALENNRSFLNLSRLQKMFQRAFAFSVLSGNVYVVMKQASAVAHGFIAGYVPSEVLEKANGTREMAYRHIGMSEFAYHFARSKAGLGDISLKELRESDYFKGRVRGKGYMLADVGRQDPGRKRSLAGVPAEKMLDMIEVVDVEANLHSMHALANAFYASAREQNNKAGKPFTDEQLKEMSIRQVGTALEMGAQPLTASQKSMYQASGGLLSNLAFCMKSEAMNKLGMMCSMWASGEKVASVQAWVVLGSMNAALAWLIEWLRGGGDDDDRWKKYMVTALLGDISAVPILSDSVNQLSAMITGERYLANNYSRALLDVEGITRSIKKEYDHVSGNKEMEWDKRFRNWTTIARAAGAGGAFSTSANAIVSTPGALLLSAATGANVSRFGKDLLVKFGVLPEPEKK